MNLQSLELSASPLVSAAEPAPDAAGGPPAASGFGQLFGELAGRLPPGQGLAADGGPGPGGEPAIPEMSAAGDESGLAAWSDPAAAWLAMAGVAPPQADSRLAPGPLSAGALAGAPGAAAASGLALQAVDLGPSLRLITPASPSPDGASLAAFAKAQGLDEAAVRWLLGDGATQTQAVQTQSGPAQAGQVAGPAVTALAGVAAPLLAAAPGWSAQAWLGRAEPPPEPQAGELAALVAAARAGARGPALAPMPAPAQASNLAGTATPALMPEVWLDMSAELPQGLDGPDALQALQAWLAQDSEASDMALPDPESGLDRALPRLAGEAGPSPASGSGPAAPAEPAGRTPSALPVAGAERPAQAEQTQRSEQFQALSQRLGEAMAQRLVAQAERGHWNVRFMLRPQSLGQVEVELRLRSGEMDAMFRTAHALTRDLLNEGLPRLREVLSQMGMDVAQVQVSTGQGQKNGGNPTPRPARPTTGSGGPAAVDEVAASALPTPVRRGGVQGLDVLV